MSDQGAYQTTLAYLENEVDGFVGASFADSVTGSVHVAHCVQAEFALAAWVTAAGDVLRTQVKAAHALRASLPEEVLVTSGDQIHLIRPVSATVFLFVAVARETSNLAMLRLAVKSRAAHLSG